MSDGTSWTERLGALAAGQEWTPQLLAGDVAAALDAIRAALAEIGRLRESERFYRNEAESARDDANGMHEQWKEAMDKLGRMRADLDDAESEKSRYVREQAGRIRELEAQALDLTERLIIAEAQVRALSEANDAYASATGWPEEGRK